MKHLINREDYIKEYLYIKNETKSENELYEGLLSTLFGGLKMLLKKDWANIKCKNPSVLTYLKSIDKSLGGYTLTKMQFSGECQTIRQNVADYFNDILDYKLSQLDKIEKEDDANKFIENENKEKDNNKDAKGVAKKLNLKDKTILDSIDKYKSNINIACKPSPKLREYADLMLNSVEVFVNDIVLAELEKKGADKEKLEKERKKIEEKQKKLKEIRNKMNKLSKDAGDKALKKLAKERDDAIRSLEVKPIGVMDGDKAVDTIMKQFNDMIGEFNAGKINESALPTDYTEIMRSDTYIGIQKSLEELDWKFSENEENAGQEFYDKFLIRVILNKINTVFGVISKNKDIFKGVPSASVQAMMIALSNAVIYGFMGDKFNVEKNNARLSLLTKCAIDSDATIGFNLPLIDPKKPDDGNFFVGIMNQFKNENISSKEVESAVKLMSKKEIEDILKARGEEKEDSNEESANNEDINTDDKLTSDTKDQLKFAKQFGPLVMKDFRQNITKLFDLIVNKAKKLKEKAQKQREAEAAKAQQESESSENV